MERDEDPQHGLRNRQTLAVLIAIILIALGGWWVLRELQHHREIGDCIASGRRDCLPIAPSK
jgi:hypothetical protein